ncbi:MAG: hypothetical protein DSZ29_01165 [Aquificaceae bacterium]|nr:MAG: hypothetical protein DSZ29_01165 [Aquificaceae bacterium]
MKTQLIIATIALTFSLGAYADGGHAHEAVDHSKMDHSNMTPAQMKAMNMQGGNMQGMDHSKMDHSKMTMPQMQAMKKAMDAEMIKIINTVDINQRKKLYVAHKKSMQSMQAAMMKQCAK